MVSINVKTIRFVVNELKRSTWSVGNRIYPFFMKPQTSNSLINVLCFKLPIYYAILNTGSLNIESDLSGGMFSAS